MLDDVKITLKSHFIRICHYVCNGVMDVIYPGGGGGGGTLIFSHIRRLGPFFGFKILNFNIFGFFIKMNIFGGMKILWICFWGHHKIGLV